MAIIRVRGTDTTHPMIVLNNREGLIYPFNVGTWSEIVVGLQHAYTSNTSWSGNYGADSQANSSIRANGFYFGLKDSGTSFPQTSGCTFIGIGAPASGNFSSQIVVNAFAGYNGTNENSCQLTYNTLSTPWFRPAGPTNSFGILNTQNFNVAAARTSAWKIQLGTSVGGKSTIFAYLQDMGSSVTVGNSTALRTSVLNANSYTLIASGYLTDTLTDAGNNIPPPNSFFCYLPYFSTQLVVNGIYVEKTA